MVTVGLVVEGTHDFLMLQPLVTVELRKRTADAISFRHLQPMQDATGSYGGGGWSRVATWCLTNAGANLETFFSPLFANDPGCDLIVIHLDGDALEKLEPHTQIAIPQQPISVQQRVSTLTAIIDRWLSISAQRRSNLAFALPVLHTEAWIVCAEGIHHCEAIDAKQLFRSTFVPATHGKLAVFYENRSSAVQPVYAHMQHSISYQAFSQEVAAVVF